MPKGFCKDCDCATARPDQGEAVYDCHFFPPSPIGLYSRVKASDFCVQFRPAVQITAPTTAAADTRAGRVERETRPAQAAQTRAKPSKAKRS